MSAAFDRAREAVERYEKVVRDPKALVDLPVNELSDGELLWLLGQDCLRLGA